MSGASPAVESPPPGLGRGACCYLHENNLLPQTAFADAQRHLQECHAREDPEEPIPKEDNPDWM